MAHLRKASAFIPCWALLASLCFGAQKDNTHLKSLYDSHQWFELRDSIRKGGAPPFYQGAVACAFNNVRRCEKMLGNVFKSAARSDEAVEAHRILASAHFTHGQYKKGLAQIDAILGPRPTDADALSDRPVFSALADAPDQQIAGRHSTVQLEDGGLPFSINGVHAAYWFDTGAELSVLTESEAKRFGLGAQPVSVQVGDVTVLSSAHGLRSRMNFRSAPSG